MTIKELIQTEINDYTKVIKEEIGIENINLKDCNYEINQTIYTHIRDSIKFDLLNENGDYYYSMLGKGKQIEYSDLYEILKRLYKVHHSSQEFTLKYEEYTVDINIHNLGDNPFNSDIFKLIMNGINNNEEFLKVSDFQ